MKALLVFLISCFLLVSCKKERPCYPKSGFYQSQGNVLIVVCGEEIDSVYEFKRSNSTPILDSVPFETLNVFNFQNQEYTKHVLLQGIDSIYSKPQFGNIGVPRTAIHPYYLEQTDDLLEVENTSFQNHSFSSPLIVQNYWNKIAGLTLVKKYRENNSSKIVCFRVIDFVYDEEIGFSIPTEKAIFVLVRNLD